MPLTPAAPHQRATLPRLHNHASLVAHGHG